MVLVARAARGWMVDRNRHQGGEHHGGAWHLQRELDQRLCRDTGDTGDGPDT
jgi:hypothetical protein